MLLPAAPLMPPLALMAPLVFRTTAEAIANPTAPLEFSRCSALQILALLLDLLDAPTQPFVSKMNVENAEDAILMLPILVKFAETA
jgi:hypothetical protein